MRQYLIDIAHNDERNGLPSGVCYAIEIRYDGYLEGKSTCRLDYGHCKFQKLPNPRTKDGFDRYQFGHVRVYMKLVQEWMGNWCWDEFIIEEDALEKVLMTTWGQFTIEEAAPEVFEYYNKDGFSAKEFLKKLREE